MKCATQIDRKNKCKWIIVCILLVMLLVVLSAIIIYSITNYFARCNNKDCEIYGYRNIEDNWYMLIEDPPE